MRDLEQIRERGDEGEGRPLALVGLLIGVTLALVFAIGSAVGWTDDAGAAEADPIARLDSSAGLTAEPEAAIAAEPTAPVDPASLSFPRALGPADDRPEVAAVLAAAAAELEHPDPLDYLPPMAAEPRLATAEAAVARALPASVAAGHGSDALARASLTDPLVASSLPAAPATAAAPVGHDGEYTVQVISYPERESAEAFAEGLRSRGHRAFVMSAELPDRGTWYRVRIGPFDSAGEANQFRRGFEASEGMNTLVVRRRE
ncbi:MAG: SPOR domain-containing protein [Sandaracinaceae bacterium]